MLTTRIMHIHVPRTGGTTLQYMPLKGSPVGYKGPWPYEGMPPTKGFRRNSAKYTFPGHWPYDILADVCRQAGHKVPPAFTIRRNPFDWHVSRWCWIRVNGYKISLEEYLMRVQSGKHSPLNMSWARLGDIWDFLGCDRVQYIGRYELFEADVARILTFIMPDLVTPRWIRGGLAQRKRKTKHNYYRRYYTNRTQELVEKMDEDFLKRFRYEF